MLMIAEMPKAEELRREIKGLVWKIIHGDESDVLELYCVIGTSTSMASSWRVGGLRSVVGLSEPQCVADQSVAEKLGLDLSKDGVEDRRVSGTVFQRTSFDPVSPFSLL